MTRKLKNYWTRVSEWTLQPSGVDTDSSESPAPRRARPPRAPPLRLRPRTPRAGPAAAPLRRPGARAASGRARARYPGEQRIQMGNLHPRAAVETTCPVRGPTAVARPADARSCRAARDPLPPAGPRRLRTRRRHAPSARHRASPRRPGRSEGGESRQTLEPYRATASVRELGILCSARVKPLHGVTSGVAPSSWAGSPRAVPGGSSEATPNPFRRRERAAATRPLGQTKFSLY